MARINQYHPQIVSHPGETLKEKLEELNMGAKEFAIRTGKPEKTITAILNGTSSITSDMAVFYSMGHILLHGKKFISLENVEYEDKNDLKEQEANDFANTCIFGKKGSNKENDFLKKSGKSNFKNHVILPLKST